MRFALASESDDVDDRHAIGPGLAVGPALCDIPEPPTGWRLSGCTSTTDRITCGVCVRIAHGMIAAVEQASAAMAVDVR